jgi:hypothetical protein
MKKLFYIAAILIILFEIANVYFIMPFPGSQRMNSLDFAYFLNSWKWIIRGVLYVLLLLGFGPALKGKWRAVLLMIFVSGSITWLINTRITASSLFKVMKTKSFANWQNNMVDSNRLVIGVDFNGEARAYPMNVIAYHHRVYDTVGNKTIMVTYCSVCRSGRVFEPIVNGKIENFRLVGMDHFNAMFEDNTTHSWWRQENGIAVAGPLKGKMLPELPSIQMSLAEWIKLYPNGKILQPDTHFRKAYDHLKGFDDGSRKGKLEGMDTGSWKEKSWIVGITVKSKNPPYATFAKAYDWALLKQVKAIADTFQNRRLIVWIGTNSAGFYAYYLPAQINETKTLIVNADNSVQQGEDFIIYPNGMLGWRHSGKTEKLEKVNAYQEFWHSWKYFMGDARYMKK